MKIVTGFLTGWRVASKTQPLRAKPLITLLVDRQVASKFLLDTLEGREPLGDGSIVCIGGAGDAWQQTQKKLLAKYDVTEIDKDGWMVCTPKPDNAVNCLEMSADTLKALLLTENLTVPFPDDRMYNMGSFAIEGQWGSAERPSWNTNCSFGYNIENNFRINIQVANLEQLVDIHAFLTTKFNAYQKSLLALNLTSKEVPFKWLNFTYEQWVADIETRINGLRIKSKKDELAKLEERVNALVSPEQRRAIELEKLVKEIG